MVAANDRESDKKSSHQSGYVVDARGRRVRQLDPYTLRLFRHHDVIPNDVLSEIAAEIGSGWRKWQRILLIITLLCMSISLIAVGVKGVRMLLVHNFSFHELIRTVVPFNGAWVGPFMFWVGAYQVRSQRTKKVMLTHRRCPHCGYDLRGLPVDTKDNATVCPECGCAWHLAVAEA